MARFRRSALATLALVSVTVPAAVAATGSGPAPTSAGSSPAPSASGQPTDGVPHISVEKPFTMALDEHGAIKSSGLPTAESLFTKKELAQVLPGLSALSVDHDTQTLTLTVKGDSNNTMQLVLKRFGKKADVSKAWETEKAAHQRRAAQDKGLYTFFGNKLGGEDAFTDGTNTHVLVTNGDAAGEIWFSGSGFTGLASTYDASRTAYAHRVAPALVRLIADKAAAGAERSPATATAR